MAMEVKYKNIIGVMLSFSTLIFLQLERAFRRICVTISFARRFVKMAYMRVKMRI